MSDVHPETVLYAEDDENDAYFMRRAFRRGQLPASLQIVQNGALAVQYLAGADQFADRELFPLPALVLLDLKMPELNGLDVLEWIRQQPRFQRLPVILLTSSSQASDLQAAFLLNANGYVLKPANAEALTKIIVALHTQCIGAANPPTGWLNFEGNHRPPPIRSPDGNGERSRTGQTLD